MLETGSVVAGNESIQRKLLKQLKAVQIPRDAVAAADRHASDTHGGEIDRD